MDVKTIFGNWWSDGPLQYSDLRVFGFASILSSVGLTAEQVVVGWYVLELTDSAFMVGLVLGVRMLSNTIFGIPSGIVADMVNRPKFIRSLRVATAAPILLLGILIVTGSAGVWHVLVLTVIAGVFQVFESTASSSFVYDVVGSEGAIQGLALLSMIGRMGRVIGSISVGFVIGYLGSGYALVGTSAVFFIASLTMMNIRSRGQAAPSSKDSLRETVNQFFKELLTNRTLIIMFSATALVEILGFSHKVLLPSLARDVLDVGAEGLGIMNGVGSLGGIIGILLLTIGRRHDRRKGISYLITILIFGCSLMALSLASNFIFVLLVLAVINGVMALSDLLSQGIMQLVVPNKFRGRAMGSWMLALGAGPIGTLQIGAIASLSGVSVALAINGFGLVILASLFILLPMIRRI